jgi:hypothetical protein
MFTLLGSRALVTLPQVPWVPKRSGCSG